MTDDSDQPIIQYEPPVEDYELSESMNNLSKEKALNPASTGIAVLQTNALSLLDTFTQYLAIMRGSGGIIQGLIVSVRQLGTALLQPLWGHFSDVYGRRRFMALGLIIMSIIAFLLPFAPTPESILVLIAIQAVFGTMLIPAWTAWIGDRTTRGNRAQTFGKISMIGVWSAMIVNVIISLNMDINDPNLENVESLRTPMHLASILAVSSAILVLFLSGERPRITKTAKQKKSAIERVKDTFEEMDNKFLKFIAIEGIFYFTWAAAWPLFPYVQFDVASNWVDLAYMGLFINVPMGLSYFYGGKLADKIGYKKILLITRPVLVLPPIFFALSLYYNEIALTFLANFSVGVTLGAALVSVNSLIMEYAPETKRASYLSVHAMTIGIVAFVSSTIIGLILQKLAGDTRPPNELIITLLFIVAGMRLFGNIGYYFVPCPDSLDK